MTDPLRLRRLLQPLLPARRARLLRALDDPVRRWIDHDFGWRTHPGQLPPPGDWRTWVLKAGRGFGKTRAGAEWVLGVVRDGGEDAVARHGNKSHVVGRTVDAGRAHSSQELAGANSVRIGLVAASIDEARAVMVEGPSGLLNCARPGEIDDWSPSNKLLRFAGGAEARLYSGARAEGLRGADLDLAWCDELAKWPQGKKAWGNLQLALRRGSDPRCLITTTPRGGTVLSAILAAADTVETGGATRDNPFNAAGFAAALEAEHGGTRWGLQELEGKLLEDVEGSLWPAELLERCRRGVSTSLDTNGNDDRSRHPPLVSSEVERPFRRVVVGVDPPASAAGTCGIVVCATGPSSAVTGVNPVTSDAVDRAGRPFSESANSHSYSQPLSAYVLADASVSGASPEGWARAVVAAAERWGADRVIAEVNQGGDMVKATLRACSATLPVRTVHATRGKAARAEPVAALFENGRAWLCGRFPDLEAELTGLQAGGGYEGPGVSPDRADAMVWALWALMLEPHSEPRVRFL